MGYYSVLLIAFIVLVIIRANSAKINRFTALLCLAIIVSTVQIVLDWKLHEVFFAVASVVIIVLAFWTGKKLRNEENRKGVTSKRTDGKIRNTIAGTHCCKHSYNILNAIKK